MNILRVEQKFKELDKKEKKLEYYFNPRIKPISGLKRHRFLRDLSYDVDMNHQICKFDGLAKAEDQLKPVKETVRDILSNQAKQISRRRKIMNVSTLKITRDKSLKPQVQQSPKDASTIKIPLPNIQILTIKSSSLFYSDIKNKYSNEILIEKKAIGTEEQLVLQLKCKVKK